MINYSPVLPISKNGQIKVNSIPPIPALAAHNKENTTASSILLLSEDTTELEISAVTTGVAARWLLQDTIDASTASTSVITAAATAAYDFIVPAGETRRVIVPKATQVASEGSIMGINRAEGLYPAIALKSITSGAGSVLTAEY